MALEQALNFKFPYTTYCKLVNLSKTFRSGIVDTDAAGNYIMGGWIYLSE